MAVRYGPRVINQPRVPIQITARSLLLVSSGIVRKCEKESMMAKIRKRMVKWGLSTAKVGLAASILVAPAVTAQASEFDGFDGLDFGAIVQRGLERASQVWFGVGKPLKESAAPTSGPYRTAAQNASAQVLLAEGLKAEYVTRNAGNAADMFAFWPSDENPTHLVFCIEGDREDLGVLLPGAGVNKLNPGVQRIRLSTGSVDTLVRGTDSCDGVRRTPWGTILFTEEASDGGAYEIIDPLNVINHTITNRAAGTIIDETGVTAMKVIKRPALPTMAWEGIGILPSGVLYAGDELRPGTGTPNADGGAMFKFIPVNVRTAPTPITMLSESPFAAGMYGPYRSLASLATSSSDRAVRSATGPGSASAPPMRALTPTPQARPATTGRRIWRSTRNSKGPAYDSAGRTPATPVGKTTARSSAVWTRLRTQAPNPADRDGKPVCRGRC